MRPMGLADKLATTAAAEARKSSGDAMKRYRDAATATFLDSLANKSQWSPASRIPIIPVDGVNYLGGALSDPGIAHPISVAAGKRYRFRTTIINGDALGSAGNATLVGFGK